MVATFLKQQPGPGGNEIIWSILLDATRTTTLRRHHLPGEMAR
jgi:hypothetical protein